MRLGASWWLGLVVTRCLILLDLSSAFDTVDHQILLSILNHHFNVTDSALTWFETYLSDRTNAFCYDGITKVD